MCERLPRAAGVLEFELDRSVKPKPTRMRGGVKRARACKRLFSQKPLRARCRRTREVGEGPAVIKHMHTRALALAETLRVRCRRMRELGGGPAVIKLVHTRLLI